MKKYIFYILAFVFVLSACSNVPSEEQKHSDTITPILYYEDGPGLFGLDTFTYVLKSSKLEKHKDYTRGFTYAIPVESIEIAEKKYSLPPDKWQILDSTTYKDNEIFIASNHRSANSEFCVINNGDKYSLPLSKSGGYSNWQIDNNMFYLFDLEHSDNWKLTIYSLDLLSGEYTIDKVSSDYPQNMIEKPDLQENFFIDGDNLYFTEYLDLQKKMMLSRYNFTEKTFEHFALEGNIADYFLLDDEILIMSSSPKSDLVIDRLDYNLTVKETLVETPPNKYQFFRFASDDKMAILDGVLYGTMGRDDGANAFFGYDIVNKKWTDVFDVSKSDKRLMDIRLTYENSEGKLIELQPHINNTK